MIYLIDLYMKVGPNKIKNEVAKLKKKYNIIGIPAVATKRSTKKVLAGRKMRDWPRERIIYAGSRKRN